MLCNIAKIILYIQPVDKQQYMHAINRDYGYSIYWVIYRLLSRRLQQSAASLATYLIQLLISLCPM